MRWKDRAHNRLYTRLSFYQQYGAMVGPWRMQGRRVPEELRELLDGFASPVNEALNRLCWAMLSIAPKRKEP